MRIDVRESFSQSVSGTDLVVGARTGPVQLMLYAVFRVGGATNNMRMESIEAIAQHRAVAWVVPLSLGDSHRGFPVLGTTPDYFERFRYGDRQPLRLAQGAPFSGDLDGLYEAVLGAEVAQRAGLPARATASRSATAAAALPGSEHADKPFTVVGILARTGTPVDRTVHISLQAHRGDPPRLVGRRADAGPGASRPSRRASSTCAPKQVTAALVGLKSRAAVFEVQRFVNEYEGEPLMAVLPGVALDELWDVVGVGEQALLGLSALVALVSLAGLVAVVLAGLNERRRELAVLRAVGAGPRHVLVLLAAEGLLVTLAGVLLGAARLRGAGRRLPGPGCSSTSASALQARRAERRRSGLLLAAVLAAGVLASLVPGLARLPPVAGRRPVAAQLNEELDHEREPTRLADRDAPLAPAGPAAAAGAPVQARPPKRRPAAPAARRLATRNHLGRTGAQGLGPAQGVQGHQLRRAATTATRAPPRMLKKMRETWDNAPTNTAMDGKPIRIPGYVVPLEDGKAGMTRVPARALLRRLHPHAAAAGQPDHPRAPARARQGRALDGRGVDQRHAEDAAHRHLHGRQRLPDGSRGRSRSTPTRSRPRSLQPVVEQLRAGEEHAGVGEPVEPARARCAA